MSKEKNEASFFTHLDKIYWPEEGYTKGDMIEYYHLIGKYILPYLKNRPLMLRRYPNGIEGESFVQKNIQNPPDWMKTVTIQHAEEKLVRYVVTDNVETLLYVANLGSIELHPMITQIDTLDNPDFIAIDLDPEAVSFKLVVETANHVHEYFEELSIPHYCKTSGGRGLHIYIPLKGKYPFEQTEKMAELLAHYIQQKLPSIISLERLPKKRQGKIYIDFLQNKQGHTMVAPYSLRARLHAPVSTPLEWKEVNNHLDPLDFNIKTVPARLKKMGDLFKPTLTKAVNLKTLVNRLSKLI